jgi:glycosyltransferase involved in cell wall biosynthesis
MIKENELDILIPVFNEDETIVKTIENIFSAVKYDYKIIICYDYDEDPTLKIIKESFPHNSEIVFVKNFAQGFNNALISGFKSSTAKAVLVFMADDHINHNIINLCYEKFTEGYQVVCPSRFIKGGKMTGNPFLKGIITKLVSFFLFNFTSFPIKDSTNSFRLFSKELINKVKIESNKGFTLSLELTAKAHRLGYKITEIPTIWVERDKGKSRFKLFSFILPYAKWLYYIVKTSMFYKNAK